MKPSTRPLFGMLVVGASCSLSANAFAQSSAPSVLDVTLGGKVLSRSLNYTDTLPERVPSGNADAPRDFHLPFGPAPFIQAGYYPLANRGGWLGNLGVVGSFETLLFTTSLSEHPDLRGKELATTYYRYVGGLRGRLPLRNAELGLTVRYAGQDFDVQGDRDSNGRDLYPATGYAAVEALLDGEYRMGALVLGAYGGYIQPLAFGALGSKEWFPNAHGYGLTGGGYVGYFFNDYFGVTMNLDSRAYGLDFNPVPVSDPPQTDRVAGGATDRYLSLGLGLSFRLPAKTAASAETPQSSGATPGAAATTSEKPKDAFDTFE